MSDPNRADFAYGNTIQTRWMDNDIYGHINNVQYYSYFDTVVNHYLIHVGELDIHQATVIGVAIALSFAGGDSNIGLVVMALVIAITTGSAGGALAEFLAGRQQDPSRP